jgi:hypothetical protein
MTAEAFIAAIGLATLAFLVFLHLAGKILMYLEAATRLLDQIVEQTKPKGDEP